MTEENQMTNHDVIMEHARTVVTLMRNEGYDNLRILADGTVVGTIDLLYTRAICIGLNEWNWERRFCFKDRDLALAELAKLRTIDDDPSGHIATRINEFRLEKRLSESKTN